ncbi:helicase C-terminal domain-containing protein [Paenibacillus odorifer]|uniref:helicase C-terminal domain-containing protein n=1 Tax=Paenibacillus TaxID=44249 RepID=UPI00096EB857|nr:helicase C-terminal domain-containing protein [Paenibacillus odorifer]OME35112.1 ATP-dependent helicase [Paenibacillus odorifer]OME42515.1 ATP-dependent helicase [Paenibacillus odorifer]
MGSTVALSVRTLVEYVFRSGSIEPGFHGTGAMVEGTIIHQKIQKQYKEGDRKEVYLKTEISYGNLLYVVDGRCDGLLVSEDGSFTVEEIKSTSGLLDLLDEGHEVHWAQALMYAYMIALEQELSSIQVKLTYVHRATDEQKSLYRTLSFEELISFVNDTVARYAPYAEMMVHHEAKKEQSLRELSFPFSSYRKGQRHFAGAVYKSVVEKVSLFAQAPTGIGKTMSTLFPVLKAMGEGQAKGLFYLTAKTVTRFAAQEAISLLLTQGLQLHVITITAKEKACFREEGVCGKDSCPYTDGYYDRINEALMDLLEHETLMSRDTIALYAHKHKVCPFEFSLDAAYACDAVICDYNYIYDPRISLKRLTEERKRETVLLVDEAHNLVDRGREMFSASLLKAPFLEIQRQYKEMNRSLSKAAKSVNAFFISLRKICNEEGQGQWDSFPEELPALLEIFSLEAEQELIHPNSSIVSLNGEDEGENVLLDTYFAVQGMLRTFKTYDERYITYAEVRRGDVYLKLFNLDPSHLLRQMSKSFRSQILFSATLSPLSYYRDMIGAVEEDYSLTVSSPFQKEQWEVTILPVSTRYHDREASLVPLTKALSQMVSKKGNYLVFFPSYLYLQNVYQAFTENYPEIRTLMQDTGMSEQARESFLAAFSPDNDETLLGFAVLGGIFSEGVDLPGDRLNGVMVVGVGLPQLGLERNLLRQYFNARGKNGFDYAYVYPGMCKVLQAGGRLIRSETDTGIIVLADDRFLQSPYMHLLPEEWRDYLIRS